MRTSDPNVASFELAADHSRGLLYASARIAPTDTPSSAKGTASNHNRAGYRLSSMGQIMGGEGGGIHRRSSALV